VSRTRAGQFVTRASARPRGRRITDVGRREIRRQRLARVVIPLRTAMACGLLY